MLLCVCWVFQGAGREEKPLKATFTAWMGCRCIDRVVIMVQWGMGVFSWVSVVDKFYGGGGQVTKGVGVRFGLLS